MTSIFQAPGGVQFFRSFNRRVLLVICFFKISRSFGCGQECCQEFLKLFSLSYIFFDQSIKLLSLVSSLLSCVSIESAVGYCSATVPEFSEKTTPPSQKKRPGGRFFGFLVPKKRPEAFFLHYKSQSRDMLNFLKIRLKKQSRASHLTITLSEFPKMVYLDVLYPNLTHPAVFRVEKMSVFRTPIW